MHVLSELVNLFFNIIIVDSEELFSFSYTQLLLLHHNTHSSDNHNTAYRTEAKEERK